ncbi:site-2 protease family protein [Inmirania thermothiophila]|uniref:Zn-dependent protease n=1 Tax=Inmirania thermothiophila TaxID=1750597 RepID=A0A3N1Y0B9_9GAMM|nr:site-2 protease family protein [Inmirania thermothiophila]ROR32260.1 Zn-dependent protease [Inmirania thermothiophila]
MEELTLAQRVAVWALPILFAITVHEVAHGWVARRLGDPTAMMMGRLTLNPLRHIDPVGTVLVPLLLLFLGGFVFGWARPVPVTWENLRHPKRDMALVAAAGPAANFLMALGWALVMRLAIALGDDLAWAAVPLIYMGGAGIAINVLLMVLNLLPLPPLDGGRIATGVLPGPWAWRLARVEPYGFFILLGLIATGLLGRILGPPVHALQGAIFALAGV